MISSYLESFEDNIKVDKEKCIFCGRCSERCILDNIRMKLAPCVSACPMGVNVQGYVQLTARGDYSKAAELVLEKLPFPEIVCMVCHHPCEKACERGKKDAPVSILALKRFLLERETSRPSPMKESSSGKRIAIVGAGPAGLVAAYDLAVKGHSVSIYETEGKPGGALRSCIPAFRLPEAMVEKELSVLPTLGVKFILSTTVGRDIPLNQIMEKYDAVLLAPGMVTGKRLGIHGEDLRGVFAGRDFLKASRKGKGPSLHGVALVAGGGNMAVDAALTALRQGADKVVMIALESEDALPAFATELKQAEREGVLFRFSRGIHRINGKDGKIMGVDLQRCVSVFDEQGGFAPTFDPCSTETLKADTLIVAIGLERDQTLLEGSGFTLKDVYDADTLTLQCRSEKIFVTGDYKKGVGSVIGAMASGRMAAESINRYVNGEHMKFGREYPGPIITNFPIDHSCGAPGNRSEPRLRKFEGKGDYNLVEHALTEEQARAEASRCHSCGGPCGKYRTCWFCLPCEVDCPQKAIWVEIPYLLR
jgi:formate dehydrogenase major subunit